MLTPTYLRPRAAPQRAPSFPFPVKTSPNNASRGRSPPPGFVPFGHHVFFRVWPLSLSTRLGKLPKWLCVGRPGPVPRRGGPRRASLPDVTYPSSYRQIDVSVVSSLGRLRAPLLGTSSWVSLGCLLGVELLGSVSFFLSRSLALSLSHKCRQRGFGSGHTGLRSSRPRSAFPTFCLPVL